MRVFNSTTAQIKPGQLDAALASAAEAAALVRSHGGDVRYFISIVAGEAVHTTVFTTTYDSPEALGKAFEAMTWDPAMTEYTARAFGPEAPFTITAQTVAMDLSMERAGNSTQGSILETHVGQIHPGRVADYIAASLEVCNFVESNGATNAQVLQLTYAGAATGLGVVTWETEDLNVQASVASSWFSDDGIALQMKVNGDNPASTPVSSALYRAVPV